VGPNLKIELLGKKFEEPNGREKIFAGLPQGGVAKMQFWKGHNSKLNYWAKILSAKWQRKIFAGLPHGGSQNAIWEWPKLKIELLGKNF